MPVEVILALCFALGSTTLTSLAYVREHGAVAELPPLSLRGPARSARLLLSSRAWLLGFGMEGLGFALYVAALSLAPLALVQSVTAGGVGVLAFAASHLEGHRLTRRELLGSAIAVIGLILLGVSLAGGAETSAHGSSAQALLWLGAIAGTATLVFTSGRAFFGAGVADGIAGGLLFAAGDISTKLATEGGGRAVFIIGMVAGYLLGTALLQIGYQSETALTVAGIATLLTNAVPIAAGTVLFSEPLPHGALGIVRALAFAGVTAGAIMLAKPASRGSPQDADFRG